MSKIDIQGLRKLCDPAAPTVGPCCKHSAERHAYNGCANCGCGVRWDQHPSRFQDNTLEGLVATVGELLRTLPTALDELEQARAELASLRESHADKLSAYSRCMIECDALRAAVQAVCDIATTHRPEDREVVLRARKLVS